MDTADGSLRHRPAYTASRSSASWIYPVPDRTARTGIALRSYRILGQLGIPSFSEPSRFKACRKFERSARPATELLLPPSCSPLSPYSNASTHLPSPHSLSTHRNTPRDLCDLPTGHPPPHRPTFVPLPETPLSFRLFRQCIPTKHLPPLRLSSALRRPHTNHQLRYRSRHEGPGVRGERDTRGTRSRHRIFRDRHWEEVRQRQYLRSRRQPRQQGRQRQLLLYRLRQLLWR